MATRKSTKRKPQPNGRSTRAKKKNGRPTKFKPEYLEQAYKLCLLGATDEEMADFFGVRVTTIDNWKKKRKKFLGAVKRGKIAADANVAESLYKRACGYEHPEDKIFCTDGNVTTVATTKHYPPDTAAAFIWLKNRAGWTDKRDVNLSGEVILKPPKIA